MTSRLRRTLLALSAGALLLMPLTLYAQNEAVGYGVVRLSADIRYEGNVAALSPLQCLGAACDALHSLLYPRLFDVDANTGALLTAGESERALALDTPTELPAETITLRLRQDRVWSDGTPITAYDVLFSLLAYQSANMPVFFPAGGELVGVGIVDEYTLTLRYAASEEEIASADHSTSLAVTDAFAEATATPTCDDLPRTNRFIMPAHPVEPRFRAFVDAHAPAEETPTFTAWIEAYRDQRLHDLGSFSEMPVTGGAYVSQGINIDNVTQFTPNDEAGAVLEAIPNITVSAIDQFIAGETNLLLNVPAEDRANLRALSDPNLRNIQIAEVPGREAWIVLLNFADTVRPLPAFHPVTGETLNQGAHPLFDDFIVRRALQLATEQNRLIEGVLQASAQPLAGLLPPASWAYDSSLPLAETNVLAANRLLDEAGWFDTDGDGVRECARCDSAPPGTRLEFSLSVPGDAVSYSLAEQLSRQWRRIGAGAYAGSGDPSWLGRQIFDAYLLPLGNTHLLDADPDRTLLLTPAGDLLDTNIVVPLQNYGSYENTEVTRLAQAARTLPGCNLAERADLYAELERVLQADLPFLSIAAPDEFYAAAPNVVGFAPRTGDPLWNVESWRVTP